MISNEIAVDDHQVPDTGTSEKFGGHAAERPAPEYECGRPVQPLLTLLAETWQQRLAVVAGQVVTHVRAKQPAFRVAVERVFPDAERLRSPVAVFFR